MKKLSVLFALFTIILAISGCEQKSEKISGQPADSNEFWDGTPPAEEAIPDFFADAPEINSFPDSVVGLWEAELYDPPVRWQIQFEPDGSIQRIYHSLAEEVKIEEGGTAVNGPDNSYYIFTMGPCEARYIPETRNLKVKIIVDYFIMKVPGGEVEGRIEDYFEGALSQDGKIWISQWLNFNWVKSSSLPPFDYIKANPEPLIFVKIDPNNPPEEPPLQ